MCFTSIVFLYTSVVLFMHVYSQLYELEKYHSFLVLYITDSDYFSAS